MRTNCLRIFMIGFMGVICIIILAPAYLAGRSHFVAAALAYCIFSPVCHQIPERSFFLWGYPLAVCHRCSGIYLGLFLGLFLPLKGDFLFCFPIRRRIFVLCSCAPIIFDAFLPHLGIWPNTAVSRFVTGLFFGSMSALLMARALTEYLAEAPWNRLIIHSNAKGVIS
jgi:uncharacterized membrane protein